VADAFGLQKDVRFGIPRHAQPASIGENSGEILRSVYVRLNIAVEFEDILGKRALERSSARLRGNPKDRQSRPATTPRGFRSRCRLLTLSPRPHNTPSFRCAGSRLGRRSSLDWR